MREVAGDTKAVQTQTLALLEYGSPAVRTLGCLLLLAYPSEDVPLRLLPAIPAILEFAAKHNRLGPLIISLERILKNSLQWGILDNELKIPDPKQNQNPTSWWMSILVNSPHLEIKQMAWEFWKNEQPLSVDIGMQLFAYFSPCIPSIARDIRHSLLIQNICGVVSEQDMEKFCLQKRMIYLIYLTPWRLVRITRAFI